MDKYAFQGRESHGFLLKGTISHEKALALAGGEFNFATSDSPDHVRCALLVVRIEQLSTWGIPILRWTYPEAVWMLELCDNSFLAIKAHTPAYMLGALILMDKYNTDLGSMELSKTGDSATILVSTKTSKFSARLEGSTQGDTELISNLWTRNRNGRYYRIPWGNSKPTSVYRLNCNIEDSTLGDEVFGKDIVWDDEAIYFIERMHQCAPAYSESPET
ncbi:hypothetical protein ElyMa_003801800 [Elysia marginata]|uniref:Uncharacterized protein n=1 Tax=Elysia marginata TaxID=1093978 RepID=A0AAV4FE94_9GAST|nr:hypothetical protein ElyMa_003801800 [Elysia marginata]